MLSLCCGDGFFEKHYYSKRCSSIVAVDRDNSALAYASRLHMAPNIDYRLSDIFDLDFPSNSFDVVVLRSAIEHFTEDQQRDMAASTKRWLKPGGWFVGDTQLILNIMNQTSFWSTMNTSGALKMKCAKI